MHAEDRNIALSLLCANECSAAMREIAAGEVDWEYVFQLARRHSIVPLVYVQLQHMPQISYRRRVLTNSKQHLHRKLSTQQRVLTAELCRCIDLFRSEGIDGDSRTKVQYSLSSRTATSLCVVSSISTSSSIKSDVLKHARSS
jgi:hypothetical protein